MTLRITGGIWRGRHISCPSFPWLRPTMDRVRQALFDRLQNLGAVEGCVVADLFAGTGLLGIEALSRGAAVCVFVEHNPRLVVALRHTLQALGVPAERYRILKADVFSVLYRWQHLRLPSPQLILADPPYGKRWGARLLQALSDAPWLLPHSWLCLETSRWEDVPQSSTGWELSAERFFGDTRIQWWYWHGRTDATGTVSGNV